MKKELRELLHGWVSILLERHPQLRGFDDDMKWEGKPIPFKCPCCGLHWKILIADIQNIANELIKLDSLSPKKEEGNKE